VGKVVVMPGASGTFILGGMTNATFNTTLLGPTAQYQGFNLYEKNGTSTWTLTGSTTATTPWTITQGTLQISADGQLGAATGGLTFNGGTLATTTSFTSSRTTTLNAEGGTFDVAPTTMLTLIGDIGGIGALTKADTGTLVLKSANTYSGTTNVAAGTLQAGATTALSPNSAFNVAAVLDLNGFSNTIGSLSGTGIVTNNGTAPAILTAGNDNTSTTFSGTIQGGTSVLGLTKIGTGTLTLTGANSYSGGTTISGGTLQLGNGGATGSIIGNVTDNGTLAFNRGGDKKSFVGMISGSGNLVKLGSDTLVLTANNTYSGGTTIQAGTLVAGAPSPAQATSFALGKGDVFLLGGILRTPSLDPLIINVGRNYTQGLGGTLAVGVAGIDGSQYDHVLVGGNASVNGTLSVFSLNNFRPVDGNTFEVLHSNGTRSGQFAQVNDFLNNNPNLQQIDIYGPNGVALLYVAATTPAPPSTPGGPNPRPPIIDVEPEPLPPVAPNEPLPPSFVLPVLDPTAEQLTAMYEIGFSEANTQRFKLDERFDAIQSGSTGFVSNLPPAPPPVTATTTGKEIAPKQPVLPPPPPEYRWGVWANGWGDWVSVSNEGSAKGYDFITGGFIIGVTGLRIILQLA
jgi:autotransporter-associated beta strand protein